MNPNGALTMLEKTIQKTFLLLFLLAAAAAIVISISQNVNATDSKVNVKALQQAASNAVPASLDEVIKASGLTLGGTNPIKPLRNVSGMVLLANVEGDLVGHITDETNDTATLKLLGLKPQLISIAR